MNASKGISIRKRVAFFAVGTLMALMSCGAASAHGSTRQVRADVRCVVVALKVMRVRTPKSRLIGLITGAYYLGRLAGEASPRQTDRMIERVSEGMTRAEFRVNADRCGKRLTKVGARLSRLGARMMRGQRAG